MPRRTMKRGKRNTRKIGGRKGKKASRKQNKSQRKKGGMSIFGKKDTSKTIDWSKSFEADRKATSLGGMIYHLSWNAEQQILMLTFDKLGRILQGFAGIKNKIIELLRIISDNAAENLKNIAGVKGPLTGTDYGGWSRNNIITISVSSGMISSVIVSNYAIPEEPLVKHLLNKGEVVKPESWEQLKTMLLDLYQDGLLVNYKESDNGLGTDGAETVTGTDGAETGTDDNGNGETGN